MVTLSLRLPASLHKQLRTLAEQEGISINQFVVSILKEKVSVLMTEEYLLERGVRGSREAFEQVLAKVPDVPAAARDQLDNEGDEG